MADRARLRVLREFYAGFVRARAMTRHFRRRPLAFFEAVFRSTASRDIPPALAHALVQASRRDRETLLALLGTSADGLSEERAGEIRERSGPNEIAHEKPQPWWAHLWHCYRNPFNLLLTALAVVSWATHDLESTTVIAIMVGLSTLLRFWQEGKSNRAADGLKEMVGNTATVLRGHERIELPIRQLVPGDVLALSAGDMIPADLRVLAAKDLFVSQASMTGESLPVEKFDAPHSEAAATAPELENILLMGTNVVSGSALAVTLATGDRTYFGAMAQRVTAVDPAPTAFQAGVNRVSWLLIRFMMVMAPLVLLVNGLTKGDWLEATLFALSVAVGLTPEMLPMIVTSTLAKGAVTMSRHRVIVKRLDAIQNFGAMDVLCADKTGTLTQDRIFLARHIDVFGEESDAVLEYAYLNSHYQTGLRNLLDVAVLEHVEVHAELDVARAFRKVDEIPFDFTRRRMSVVVAEHDEHHLLICKGAVEEMLGICTRVRHGELDEPITGEIRRRLREVTDALNEDGMRVVAVAVRELPPLEYAYGVADEADMTLVGYIAFLDPPKESTAAALEALATHGVVVKILTGDNDLVAAKICREVGLPTRGVVLGSVIEAMDERELAEAVEAHNLFARLTPAHKERIVRALMANRHVVGFLGDGINDAPALRAADIGISVDSAVDIAKESADIVLLEKSLMVLEEGVVEGRRIFANMLKYIKMTASSNFGNVFSVLVASAFLPFLPMLPIQLLTQNLLYDVSQVAIPFDDVDPEQIERPQQWRTGDIGRFMVCFGPLSSVFDILTFWTMWNVFGADSIERQALFQSGWFVVGLLTQTLIVHMIRTRRIPFVQSRAATPLLATTAVVVAIGVFLPMGPLGPYFRMESLPGAYFVLLPFIVLGYMALVQAVKGVYARRYGWQ